MSNETTYIASGIDKDNKSTEHNSNNKSITDRATGNICHRLRNDQSGCHRQERVGAMDYGGHLGQEDETDAQQ